MDREILMAGTRRKEQRAKTKKHRKGNEVLYEPQSYSLEARLEGEKERRFRRDVLWFDGFEVVASGGAVAVYFVAQLYTPSDVEYVCFYGMVTAALNAVVLFICWLVLYARGTGKHHLYAFVVFTIVALGCTGIETWFAVKLALARSRTEALCFARRMQGIPQLSLGCEAQWALLASCVIAYLALINAANLALCVFSYKMLEHGRKRHLAVEAGDQAALLGPGSAASSLPTVPPPPPPLDCGGEAIPLQGLSGGAGSAQGKRSYRSHHR